MSITKADVEQAWEKFKALDGIGKGSVAAKLFGFVDAGWPRKNAQALARALVETVDHEFRLQTTINPGAKP